MSCIKSDVVAWYNSIVTGDGAGPPPKDFSELSRALDSCFDMRNLPIKLDSIIDKLTTQSGDFLHGQILEKLFVVAFNEEDRRISDMHTKEQVLKIVFKLVNKSRDGRIKARRAIQSVDIWIDEIEPEEGKFKAWSESLLKSTKKLFLSCWKVEKPLSRAILENFEMPLEIALDTILRYYGAMQMQAIIRSFLARRRLARDLRDAAERQRNELKRWSILVIQKVARGYIARKTIIRSMRIRKQLSKEVLRVAEKFMLSGDVWGFLQEINSELLRSKNHLKETEDREDNWASSFVEKVVVQRQTDFDMAWDRFPRALRESQQLKATKSSGQATVGSLLEGHVNTSIGTAIEMTERIKPSLETSPSSLSIKGAKQSPSKSKRNDGKGNKISVAEVASAMNSMGDSHLPADADRLPGPLMRKALQTTVQVEVASQLNKIMDTRFHTKKLVKEIRSVYEPESNAEHRPIRRESSAVTGATASSSKASATRSAGRGNGSTQKKPAARSKKSMDGKEVVPVGKIQATKVDWLTVGMEEGGAGSSSGSSSDLQRQQRRTGGAVNAKASASSQNQSQSHERVGHERVQPGESLLLDVPNGLEDSIERLVHAAALRCYVPEFFRGPANSSSLTGQRLREREMHRESDGVDRHSETLDKESDAVAHNISKSDDRNTNADPNFAFEMYLQLPMGLAKIRYETECKKWSQGVINRLRVKGLNYLRDVMPVSKFRVCLNNVDAPLSLVNKCVELCVDLKNMGRLHIGATTALDVSEDTAKLIKPSQRPLPPIIRESRPSTRESEAMTAATPADAVRHVSDYAEARTDFETATADHSLSDGKELIEQASKMLQSIVESETADWCSLKASVEEILVQAAFLIVEHKPSAATAAIAQTFSSDGGDRDRDRDRDRYMSAEMGNHMFKLYAMDLLSLADEAEKEDFVRARFRAASSLTTPFAVYLRGCGISSVETLLKVDLEDLDMPLPLRMQLEVLLTAILSRQVHSRVLQVPRDLRSMRSDEFTTPAFYDTRFQRTPFDPFGRPPVIGKTTAKMRLKASDRREEERLKALQELDRVSSLAGMEVHMDEKASLWEKKPNSRPLSNSLSQSRPRSQPFMEQATRSHSHSHSHDHYQYSRHRETDESVTEVGMDAVSFKPSLISTIEDDGNTWQASNNITAENSADLNPNESIFAAHSAVTAPRSDKQKVKEKRKKASENFIQKNLSVRPIDPFKETYRCHYPGCGQVFSRNYTYKVHLKSHELFAHYHEFKTNPQLLLDILK